MRLWAVLGVLLAVAGVLGLATAAYSAKNPNTLSVVLTDFPGPTEVTYSQNAASTLLVKNEGTNPWTKVIVNAPAPATSATLKSTLKYVFCPGTLVSGVVGQTADVQCNLGTLDPQEAQTLFFVWQTPAAGSDCTPNAPPCLEETVTVTGSEGSAGPDANPSKHDDTFTRTITFSLLGAPDPLESGGYALETCTTPGKSLETNPNVGQGNPHTSAVCLSSVPGLELAPGLVVEIDEDNDADTGTNIPFQTNICIPAPGEECSDPDYVPWPFSPDATMSFVFDNKSLPAGEKIDLVIHHGEDVTDLCTITIENAIKKTFVSCPAPFNGDWRWG